MGSLCTAVQVKFCAILVENVVPVVFVACPTVLCDLCVGRKEFTLCPTAKRVAGVQRMVGGRYLSASSPCMALITSSTGTL